VQGRAGGIERFWPFSFDASVALNAGVQNRVGRLALSSGALRPDDDLDLAVEHLEQREHLVDRLAVVRRVEEAVELRR